MQDVTQQVRLVESSQKRGKVLELLQEAGLMEQGTSLRPGRTKGSGVNLERAKGLNLERGLLCSNLTPLSFMC